MAKKGKGRNSAWLISGVQSHVAAGGEDFESDIDIEEFFESVGLEQSDYGLFFSVRKLSFFR